MFKSQRFDIGTTQVVVGRLSPTLAVVSVRTVSVADYVGQHPLPPSARMGSVMSTGKVTIFTTVRRPTQLVVKPTETNLMVAQRLAAQVKKPQRRTMGR